jgi:hypothetical protein
MQIMKFNSAQTAKVLAVLYFFMSLIICIPIALFSILSVLVGPTFGGTGSSGGHYGIMFFILAPFFYAFFGFVIVGFMCLLYNAVAEKTGGISFTVSTDEKRE